MTDLSLEPALFDTDDLTLFSTELHLYTDEDSNIVIELGPVGELERHAARNSDPESSKAAVNAYSMKWDAMNMRALRVHYDSHLAHPGRGLTNYEAEVAARELGGLGKSPWKRISELHTKFNPPLITNALDDKGNRVMRRGEFDVDVEVFVITTEGIAVIQAAKRRENT